MISQFQALIEKSDGRYALDDELTFLSPYIDTYTLRLQTYQKVEAAEAQIVQQVLAKIKATEPTLLLRDNQDLTAKWKTDTIRVLRYSAAALLSDDLKTYQERFLLWFQSVMRAFGVQRSCHITHDLMQEVVKQHLTPMQAALFCPILEQNRRVLSGESLDVGR
jgi:Phycobilisome protein